MTLTPDIRAARAEIVKGRFALIGIHLPLAAMDGEAAGTVCDADGRAVIFIEDDPDALEIARLVADILNRAGGCAPEEADSG